MAKATRDLSWTYDRPLRRAVIVYDSPHGKTRRVAEALAQGIRDQDVPTDVIPLEEALSHSLAPYDLIAIGSPNAWVATSPGVRRLLKTLASFPAEGRYAFAFDLHTKGHLDGAASEIARAFEHLHLRVPIPPASAVVEHRRAGDSADGERAEYRLRGGSETAFQMLGAQLVRTIRNERADAFA